MQAESSMITKTFELTDEFSGQTNSFTIQVQYLPDSREINMSHAILSICANGLSLNNCNLFYLDVVGKVYVHMGLFPFAQVVFLKYELFLDGAIKIRYRNVSGEERKGKGAMAQGQTKSKRKVKERTIRQAMDYVNYWRELYQTVDERGKRVYTLESAANVVGLCKKTLDDYYYQLRQAQYYGFDFQMHREDKIGVLRKFVKQAIKNEAEGKMKQDDDIDIYLASASDSQEERRYK